MNTPVAVARGQLLENIHIPKLQVIVFIDMIVESKEKTVLVKIVMDDLFTEIDMNLIIQDQGEGSGGEPFFMQGQLGKKIIARPEIEKIALIQLIIVPYPAPPAFLQPEPLHNPYFFIAVMPLELLPGAVFRLGNIFMILRGEMMDIGITCGQLYIISNIISKSSPE